MTFTDCTFYAGKYAIDVYANLNGDSRSVTIDGCKIYNLHQFDDAIEEYTLEKSAIRMKVCSAGMWVVTIKDCENLGGFVKEVESGVVASSDNGIWTFVIGGGYGSGLSATINDVSYPSVSS